jgi:predicted MFS family arabinose efflux permease
MAVPIALGATPIGLAIDRYSRARLILALAVCTCLGSLATAIASDFTALFAARCLVGLAGPAIWMATMSLLSDLYTPAQRGRANMVIVVGQCVGNSAAFALGGTLLVTASGGADAWRHAMLGLTIPLAIVAFLMLLMREPSRTERSVPKPSVRAAYVELWRHRTVIGPILVGLSMLGVAEGAAVTWLAPTLSRRFALSADQVGAVAGVVLLTSGVLGPVIGGILADVCERRGGARRTMLALLALSCLTVPTGIFAVMASPVLASVLFFLFMMLSTAIIVAGTTLFTIVVPNELRGLCMGLLSAAFLLLGFGLAPLMVSVLSGALGGTSRIGEALAWVCAMTSLCAAASFTGAVRSFPPSLPR